MVSRILIILGLLSIIFSCRREEEDLTQAIDRRPSDCSNQNSDNVRGVEPPPVVISDAEAFLAAALSGNLADVRVLVETGKVDPKSVDESGRNALMLAAEFGHLPVIEYLLGIAPELSAQKDNRGLTAADYVNQSSILDEDQKELVLKLVNGEAATPEELNAELISILLEGFAEQSYQRLRVLIERGADPNSADQSIPDSPIPAIFLAMGIRASETTQRLTLQSDPIYEYAEALVNAGADMNVTIVLRGRVMTPLALLNSPGAASQFGDSRASWEKLLN